MTQSTTENIFAHKGVALQAQQLVEQLVHTVRDGAELIETTLMGESEATATMFGDGKVAEATRTALGEMLCAIRAVTDEMGALEQYWYSLPWDPSFCPDMRANQTVAECVAAAQAVPASAGPGPYFDPNLLDAKKVLNVRIMNDVRDVAEIGEDKPRFELGGDPVIWLESSDGSRLAVPKVELARLVSVLAEVLGNIDHMKPAENEPGQ